MRIVPKLFCSKIPSKEGAIYLQEVTNFARWPPLRLMTSLRDVSQGAMDKMLTAAGLKSGFDACLFEKALASADIKALVEGASKVGGGGGGGGGGGAAPAAAAAAPAAEGKKAAPPPEEEEEDMGFSLFD